MPTILHVASVFPTSSNRLALQYGYARGHYDLELLHLTATSDDPRSSDEQFGRVATLPHWPRFRITDPVFKRRLLSLIRRSINTIALLLRLLRSRADVMHAHENSSLMAIVFWGTVLRRPAVWDPHDYYHEGERSRSRLGRRNFKELLERRLIARRIPVLVVSKGMQRLYAGLYPGARIDILRNYSADRSGATESLETVRLTEERDAASGGDIRIVYPGLIRPERLELSIVQTLGEAPGVVFDIYGIDRSGEYQQLIQETIERNGYSNVRLRGAYTPQNIRSILARYHFAVFPYPVSQTNIDICLPNKFYQCIEAAVPIISTDMDEMGSIIKANGLGFVFASQDRDELGTILASIKGHDTDYSALLENVARFRSEGLDYDGERATLLANYARATD